MELLGGAPQRNERLMGSKDDVHQAWRAGTRSRKDELDRPDPQFSLARHGYATVAL